MPAAVHILLFDGFADWEPGFALAEIRRSGGLEVVSVGFDGATVRSMGGLRVVPDTTLDRVTPDVDPHGELHFAVQRSTEAPRPQSHPLRLPWIEP